MPEEKKTYIVDNTPVDVDIKDVDGFLSANPNAKEAKSFVVGNDTVDVLIDDLDGFMESVPDAKPLFEEASAPDESIVQTMKGYGAPKLGKPSAVPSASVGGGSATKGRGVEEPSTLPQRSSEASLDNIQKTMQVYADGQGAFPETLSAADVKELRKQVPGGELPNISDDKVAKMLAGKSPKQVRIASVNAIPDIKERKTEQARMYKDFSREKSAENQQLDQNIAQLNQGLAQIKAEGENLQQQLQNPNIDPQTAAMLSGQLQQIQANYDQAANDYNSELDKYQQNARFIKTMGAGVQSNLKGLIPSTIINPRSPSDVMAASAWNATAPALLKTLGAVIDVLPSPLPTDRNVVSDAIFNLADKVSVDVAKYSPQANVSLMDDVNVYNTSQLLGNLLGSVAMTFGGGAAAGATGAQAAGFSQVYGDVYKQGRDAGLTKAESMFFAMPTGIVAAYLGDKGVESLAGAFSKTSLKSAIKQGAKELAEKRTPQMMMEFGKKVLLNTLEGAGKEGAQEGLEFATEFGSKKLASLKEDVKFKDDLSLEGFGKGLAESAIAGAAGGGLLGPFFGAGRNKAFADVVNKAARDPEAEIDFMEQLDASVVANDITPEQKQQMVEMLEKTKQAASTVPPVVESEPARAEATALVLEQQDLEQQIEQTNPAMAKPLKDRLDEINARLGEIAEGKNLPTEEEAPVSEAPTEQAPQTLPEVTNEIAQLREQEQAENKAIDPNDEVAKKEIYDKYDEAITPLLEQEKELTAQASLEGNGVSLRGVKFSDIVVDDKYLEDILDENKLSDEEKKQVREVFTRGVTYFKFDKEGEQKFQEKFANPEDITDVADIITGVSAAEESNFNNYNTTNYENVKDAINYIVNNPNDYSPNVVKALTEIKEKLDNPSSSMSRLYAVDVMKELGLSEPTPTTEAQAPVAEEAKGEKAIVIEDIGDANKAIEESAKYIQPKENFKVSKNVWTHLTNSADAIKSILLKGEFISRDEKLEDFTEEVGSERFSLRRDNASAPNFQKGKLYSEDAERDSKFLITTEGDEKFIPNANRVNKKNFESSGGIGVLKPSNRDLSNFQIYKKGADGKYAPIDMSEIQKATNPEELSQAVEKILGVTESPQVGGVESTRTENDFANAKESYRVIVGDEAFNDIVDSGVVRTNADNKGISKQDGQIDLSNRPTMFPSFSKGKASMGYAKDNPNHYIVVTEDESIKPSTSGRHGKGTTMFPTDANGKHLKELSGDKVKVYKHIGDGKYELIYSNGKLVEQAAPTSEQTPQPFPAQEGAESVEDKFQANAELEQIYRDLNAAVTKNVDKDTIRMLKANPTEAMVDKAMRELQRKGIIKIDCN